MSRLPLALSVASLAMLWAYASPIMGVETWPAFVGWAVYFIAGGSPVSLVKGGLPLFSGILLAWLAVTAGSALGDLGIPVTVGIAAFSMVMMANLAPFELVPAQFVGAAVFFGAGTELVATVVSISLGLILGYVSATVPNLLTKESPV